MKQWIVGVTAASLLAALAMGLSPRGRVRQVTRLACGLMCALAVAAPLAELDIGSVAVGMAAYEARARQVVSQAEEEAKMLDRTYIEERCQAYISGKAAQAGKAVGAVRVTARWDEEALIWVPWSASVEAPYDEALATVIEGELGIPIQRQSWQDDG